jgi:hypothetical protein
LLKKHKETKHFCFADQQIPVMNHVHLDLNLAQKKRKRSNNFFESITKRNAKQKQKEYADKVDTYLKCCNTFKNEKSTPP